MKPQLRSAWCPRGRSSMEELHNLETTNHNAYPMARPTTMFYNEPLKLLTPQSSLESPAQHTRSVGHSPSPYSPNIGNQPTFFPFNNNPQSPKQVMSTSLYSPISDVPISPAFGGSLYHSPMSPHGNSQSAFSLHSPNGVPQSPPRKTSGPGGFTQRPQGGIGRALKEEEQHLTQQKEQEALAKIEALKNMYTASMYYDKIPYTTLSGEVIPEWRRGLMAKRKVENIIHAEENKILAELETWKQSSRVPDWKNLKHHN